MKKFFCFFLASSVFFNLHIFAFAENQPADYEKYGRIATAVVKEDYPGVAVVEYQYAGRQTLSESDVMDSFVFDVKDNNQLLKVTVRIAHSLKNKKLLQLSVEEKKG